MASKKIALTKGFVTVVDEDDYDFLMQWKWGVRISKHTQYACRGINVNGKTINYSMHSVIVNPPKEMEVDHINGDGLDNRRCNLRIVTKNQNQWNQRPRIGTSKYKGVCWHKRDGHWRVQIQKNHKKIVVGNFDCEIQAALSYNKAAIKYHGEFAKLNEISA